MKRVKFYFSFLAMFALLIGYAQPLSAKDSGGKEKNDQKIAGQYIVVFKDTVSDPEGTADEIVKGRGLGHLYTYTKAVKGFAAVMSDADATQLASDPRVDYVSADREVTALAQGNVSAAAQTVPTGISRIGAMGLTNEGAGVTVAVIDTGIDQSHPDLAANILNAGKSCIKRTSSSDDNGHGTHVAGTIAALDNGFGVVGVAPQARLIPVKVLDRRGSGSWSSVICGIDWVTANATRYNIKVANMSLGGSGSSDNNCGTSNNDALHQAICRSRDAGVTYIVAAGNSSANTSTSVPAAYNDAVITVSALADSNGTSGGGGPATSYGADDTFASFSNYGTEVDIGAPGVNILSTWRGGGYAAISGTSMATPHVSGAAALYLAAHPEALWSQVRDALVASGEPNNSGHTDPSGRHSEPVLKAAGL